MASGTIKQSLQYQTDFFIFHAVPGWQLIDENSTLRNGVLPPTPYRNSILCITNRGTNSTKNAMIMADGDKISLYSEIEQNITVEWHVFGGG